MADRTELDALRLLAWSIAGDPLDVVLAAPGARSGTDGRTVWVAPGDDPHDVVVVQAALARAGSLDHGLLRNLVGRPKVAQRYLALEAPRALGDVKASLPGAAVMRFASERTADPGGSLEEAKRNRGIGEAPAAFGALRPTWRRPARRETDRADHEQSPQEEHDDDALADDEDTSEERTSDAPTAAEPIPLPESLRRLFRRARRVRSEGGDGGVEVASIGATGTRGQLLIGGEVKGPALPPVVDQKGGWLHPEWNHRTGQLRPAWCRVHVFESSDEAPPRQLHVDLRARRALARAGLLREPKHRQPTGNDIDVDAVVTSVVERRLGVRVTDDLYVGDALRRRGLATLVLLDLSGSSSEQDEDLRVHERQVDAAASILSALHRHGARYAAYGFRSYGRGSVQMTELASFAERSEVPMAERLRRLQPAGFTRTGAAVRHATHILATMGLEHHRLLIVISDGHAYDDGYEGDYADADTSEALAEARRSGVATLCLSTAVRSGALVPEAFATSTSAAGPIEHLVPALGRLVARALGDVDRRRRLSANPTKE